MQLTQMGLTSYNVGDNLAIDSNGVTHVYIGGDSISVNNTGSGASSGANMYANRFIAQHSLTLVSNQAVGARGVWNQCAALQSAAWSTNALVTMNVGLNDMKRNGSAQATLNKILGSYRAMALKIIKSTSVASGSASVVRTGGTFQGYGATTVGGLFTSGALPGATRASFVTAASGAKWSYTFTGTGIGVQLICSHQASYAQAEVDIHIDGNLVDHVVMGDWYDGVSDGVYDNGRGPTAFMYFNLGGGSHTIEVTTTNTATAPVDFFSVLNSPTMTSAAALFHEIPYCTPTGYLSPPNGSIAASNACSLMIKQVVQEMRTAGYNFGYVPINSYYSLTNTADGTHPNDAGHIQLRDAMTSVFI